jgi:hypothetical protein
MNDGSTDITTDETACFVAVIRKLPDAFPRNAPTASTPKVISSRAGRSERNSVSPASVTDTDRVVRDSSRTPSLRRCSREAGFLRHHRKGRQIIQIIPLH